MRIAVAALRSRAGERGGAERFFEGLHRALVTAGHDAEIVGIEGDESTFEGIEETYLRCYDFDAGAYDAVISTKAPTYMVRHPNHVCYLVHTIRVFYDMFDASFPAAGAELRRQRALVRKLDTLALSQPRTKRVFAIGNEVAQRLLRDNGIPASVLHPPLGIEGLRPGAPGDYIFLPGRLHRWKRVHLAIAAMRSVSRPLRLLIAGTGEDERHLQKLAAGDRRIVFLGHVADAALADLYANALAVAFVPLREDYGYVTVEAFRSGKPVITCHDSGEAARLVENGRTGLVVDPEPAAIASAFERLNDDRSLSGEMGAAAREREKSMRWETVVSALCGALNVAR